MIARLILQHVLWPYYKTPPCPYSACAHEAKVLREGQFFSRAGQIAESCQDESPLNAMVSHIALI